jgi:hypothetical protein
LTTFLPGDVPNKDFAQTTQSSILPAPANSSHEQNGHVVLQDNDLHELKIVQKLVTHLISLE